MTDTPPAVALDRLSDWLRASPEARAAALAHCAATVSSRDAQIHAWVRVSPQRSSDTGALAGIPFGAKDIMETRGLCTEYGSSIYRGRVSDLDAAIVTELTRRGAVLFGKTETAAFAYVTPARTRNPRNLNHTPGGSSSGSAAAVAAGMVPLALGTQTKGSVLRPASYCGVAGFKPSFGLLSTSGILSFAPSLDTVGFFTHTALDMRALWQALDRDVSAAPCRELAVPDSLPRVDPKMATAFHAAVAALERAGVTVRRVDIVGMLEALSDAAHVVMCYEGARLHQQRYEEHGHKLRDLADLVREGLRIPSARYDAARLYIESCRRRVADLYASTPVILVPAATGPAPAGLLSTGDPSMNAPWTALGTPAISIPLPVGDQLPLGLQLTADLGYDSLLLRTAVDVEEIVAGVPAPLRLLR